MDLIIRGGTLVTPSGEMRADLGVKDGKIAALAADMPAMDGTEELDARDLFVLPGLVDGQVALGPEGPASFDAVTRAAALAGVTTVIAPAPCGPADDPGRVLTGAQVALADHARVDWSVHLAMRGDPTEIQAIPVALREHAVTSVQVTMGARDAALETADGPLLGLLRALADQALVIAKPANGSVLRHLAAQIPQRGVPPAVHHADLHPAWMEAESITRAAALAAAAEAPLLISGVSSTEGLAAVLRAKEHGSGVFAEVALAHLVGHRDLLEAPEGSLWVSEPPLRSKPDVLALWRALGSGLADTVASHHRAIPREMKGLTQTDPLRLQPGLPMLDAMLAALWSEGVEKWRLTAPGLVAVACEMPAKLYGLYPRKGSLEIGADADLVLVDAKRIASIEPAQLAGGADFHLLAGRPLKGWPIATLQRGRLIASHGEIVETPAGEWIDRHFALL